MSEVELYLERGLANDVKQEMVAAENVEVDLSFFVHKAVAYCLENLETAELLDMRFTETDGTV